MNILLSIHPEYAAMIYEGEKKIEFRTNIPRKYNLIDDMAPWDDYIFLYETAPICAVTGWIKLDRYINVNKIFNGNREALKRDIIKNGCVTFEQIKSYKPNLQLWGWNIKEAYTWNRYDPIILFSPNEKPPQSWCYTRACICGQALNFDHVLNKKSYERIENIKSYWERYRKKLERAKWGKK